MIKYIDIGINITNKQFQNDQQEVIANALQSGVFQILLTGTSVTKSEQALEIAKKYPNVLFSTAGIHPHDAKSMDTKSIANLKKLLEQDEVVAVGECGLDFDRDFSPRKQQERCYEAQLDLACTFEKPLFLHERAAFNRFLPITQQFLPQLPKAVVHCFTGTLEEAKRYLDLGFYLGFTGAITDQKRFSYLKDVIQYVPLDRIMIETDAPFMLPKNILKVNLNLKHQRRNEPAYLPYVAQYIALIKNISVERVALETTTTTQAFFNLPKYEYLM